MILQPDTGGGGLYYYYVTFNTAHACMCVVTREPRFKRDFNLRHLFRLAIHMFGFVLNRFIMCQP